MLVDDLQPVQDALQGGGNRVVTTNLLIRVLRLVRSAFGKLDERLDAGEAFALAVDSRLDTLEQAPVLQLNVVATIGDLPAAAGPRQWFRVQGDPAVYVGNGAGRPLTKLTPGSIT